LTGFTGQCKISSAAEAIAADRFQRQNQRGKTMTPISQLIQKTMLRTLNLALFSSLIIATPMLAAEKPSEHAAHQASAPAGLVQLVREGTKQYINVNNATAAGYGPFLGCVAGTDHGAMGVHYVNPTLLGNLTLDPSQPQALIYEPSSNGKMTLVGVEFILDSASWLAANNNTPPVLDGQVFNFVGAPNRFNIASFFELHVWAWRDNPQGSFVDWNNDVTCAGE
jgi:hypothetical protein